MSPKKASRPRVVREPVQVYLAPDDSDLLARLAEETGLPKAEILRRGVRSYARESAAKRTSPMLEFLEQGAKGVWKGPSDADHDAMLAQEHRRPRKRR